MSRDFWPDNETDMLAVSKNFLEKVSLDPPVYGLTAAQVASAQAACDAFAVSLAQARDTNRGSVDVARKNTDKRRLERLIRPLAAIVSAQPTIDLEQRIELGLSTTPAHSPRVGPPTDAPSVQLEPLEHCAVVKLFGETSAPRRGRPRGVKGAMIFYALADSPWRVPTQWTFIEITTKTSVRIELPPDVSGGAVVFFSACWLSPTLQRGPMSAAPAWVRVVSDQRGTLKSLAA